ncbi:unnamed protein product, partial [Polarella glacialis]
AAWALVPEICCFSVASRSARVALRASEGEPGQLPDRGELDALRTSCMLEGRSFPSGVVPSFATPVYKKRLLFEEDEILKLNAAIIKESERLRESDEDGKKWSEINYAGGYTSYGGLRSLNRVSPIFAELEDLLSSHMNKFKKQLELEGNGEMSLRDCWVNMMGSGTTHVMHQHPSATISGTYYVQTPKGSPGLTFEDPRPERSAARSRRSLVEFPVQAGDVVLFESWMRHKVSRFEGEGERISVSFNYYEAGA